MIGLNFCYFFDFFVYFNALNSSLLLGSVAVPVCYCVCCLHCFWDWFNLFYQCWRNECIKWRINGEKMNDEGCITAFVFCQLCKLIHSVCWALLSWPTENLMVAVVSVLDIIIRSFSFIFSAVPDKLPLAQHVVPIILQEGVCSVVESVTAVQANSTQRWELIEHIFCTCPHW